MGLRTSSLRIRKRLFVRRVRACGAVSATSGVCSMSTLRHGYSTSVLYIAPCTSQGGPHPVADPLYIGGQAASPTSSGRPFVRPSHSPSPTELFLVPLIDQKKKIVPPFRGENRTAPRGAYVHFRSTDAARAGFRILKGREGPAGSEALHVTMSRKSALRADLLWRWAYIEASGEGDAYFEELWNGLGFGTGRESSSAARRVESGSGKQAEPGTRGGRLKVWKDPAWNREKRDAEDTTFSHPLWTDAGDGGEGEGEKDPRFFLRAEVEREVEEGQQVARTAFLHRRQSRRGPPTTGDP